MTLPTDQAGLAGGAAQPASWQNELVTARAGRPYAGISQPERQARRRELLLEAGLEVFGTTGYAASSVREICEVAELNRRYFYESFNTREDLLRAVYEQIVAESREAIGRAVGHRGRVEEAIRAGLTAWWGRSPATPARRDHHTRDRRRQRGDRDPPPRGATQLRRLPRRPGDGTGLNRAAPAAHRTDHRRPRARRRDRRPRRRSHARRHRQLDRHDGRNLLPARIRRIRRELRAGAQRPATERSASEQAPPSA